jgi:hypothetical protein
LPDLQGELTMAATQTKRAEGNRMTLAELERFAANVRLMGGGDDTTVDARVGWGGGLRELRAKIGEYVHPLDDRPAVGD